MHISPLNPRGGLLAACVLLAATLASPASARDLKKQAQNAKALEVVFETVYKGQVSPGRTLMTLCHDQVRLRTEVPPGTGAGPRSGGRGAAVQGFVDYPALKAYTLAQLPDGSLISTSSPITLNKGLQAVRQETFLGLDCQVLRTSINSNTIEIWVTRDLPFRGTPQANVGVPDGLVLQVVRNGDMVQRAVEIRPLKTPVEVLPQAWGQVMDPSAFQYALNQSQVITVRVFDQDRLCFNGDKLPAPDSLLPDVAYRCGGGSILLKKVRLPQNVDDRSIFAEVVQYSDGDAYDRTGSIFMIPEGKRQSFLDAIRDLKSVPAFAAHGGPYPGLISTPDYDAPVELMRFFTGFGVRKFNHIRVPGQTWVDSVLYKTEVTPLAQKLSGEVWIGAYIGNWDGNGHKLSLRLKYYPNAARPVDQVLPLFNTVNYLEQAGQPYPVFLLKDSLKVSFTLDRDTPSARLFYLTTGHGGWSGGDEFNPKPNTLLLDGQKVLSFVPWRDDCGTHRQLNPCSGNFSNGLSSSDLSRSNWCPGTVTHPNHIYLGPLKAGPHSLVITIPQGAPEGGSNSYWCLSGSLIYE